ncbi:MULTISPECIES: large-conductance mechanosensitive channel protein MscL [Halomonadaceae]|uniref:large-conductance mechanosensitive channel protein MscL n=1 Tax=Halomonadaceae TaxID=28256 RepID=UPI0015975DDC|nr:MULTISPECIES: large-conductance mechanosensitive channel protein MscL [Halomonas]QJQ96685.1 large-conductance mechanosensitive channel protein MscL [Halomonas sp. PA5]
MASKFLKEFREFAVKGNVVDMAVGIIIGGAFTLIVQSLVSNVMNPLLGLLIGGVDFSNFFIVLKEGETAGPYATLQMAQEVGAVTLDYGLFLNAVISFIIVSFAVFLLIRTINRLRREESTEPQAPTDKACPFCLSAIPIKATRCAHCTSALSEGEQERLS